MRLNIASGTAVRFEPGQQRTVELVDYAGARAVCGFRGLVQGSALMAHASRRRAYAEMFGPTVGDRVRLADTELIIEVEHDYTLRAGGYGEEVKFGGGKTIRDGMGQGQRVNGPSPHEAADCVITNALILDHWGIVKADIGLQRLAHLRDRQGRQPRRADRAWTSSSARAPRSSPAKGMIVTAGGIDSHIHFICPQQIEEALASGVTTMLGGGTGPATGTLRHHLHARAREHRAHAAGGRRLCDEPRLPRQGQRQPARGAAPADRGRRDRPEAARGLGHHAVGHRLLPGGGRRDRHAGARSTATR